MIVAKTRGKPRGRKRAGKETKDETVDVASGAQLLLGNLPPRFEKVPAFTPVRPLNPEQLDAVGLALSARDFALVHGPPGTGKSTVLSELAVQFVRQGKRLLCTAASNAAVDHLLELCLDAGLNAVRVGHPARVLPHLQQHTLDLLVEEHADRKLARELFEDAFDCTTSYEWHDPRATNGEAEKTTLAAKPTAKSASSPKKRPPKKHT